MRICMWDLETTDLAALMGHLLSCSFGEWLPTGASRNHHGTPPPVYTYRLDREPWTGKNLIDDGRLAVQVRDELERYDMIVGHNIKMFDVPFLNARLAKIGERPFKAHFVLDTMYYVGYQAMRIGSKKLDNVAKYFELADQKTPISWEDWQLAATGNKAAMDQVVKHNVQDVKVLLEVYPKLLPYVANLHR